MLGHLRDVPKYEQRQALIDEYIEKMKRKRAMFVLAHRVLAFPSLKESEYDDSTVVTVKPPYQLCHDDLPLLSRRMNRIRKLLPYNLSKNKRRM